MSLFNRALRPPPTFSDETIERYLAALNRQIEPDPLFRRRLRSDVVNRFVAAREGISSPAGMSVARREMGRVGRACLYASFTLGVTAASVMAASQEALPGDPLYQLKQRIEQLRMEVVPSHLRAELAAYALGERIEEMGRLADAGRWELAIAMAPGIDLDYERLAALGATIDPASAARVERHLLALEGMIQSLPPIARAAVEDALDGDAGISADPDRPTNIDVDGAGGASSGGGTVGGPAGSPPEPSATPEPTATPEATPKPEPTVRPERSPKPEPIPSPEPSALPGAERPPQPPNASSSD
jgi:hypothetical protein